MMKRLLVFLGASALVFCLACPVMAGGIDNKHNYSAEYIRTLNRNGATDSADAVVYNPAGVVRMEDGFYGNLSVQYVMKTYTNQIDGVDYESDEPDFSPGVFALFTKDRWAGYAAFTIPAGGGEVKYDDGSATSVALGRSVAVPGNLAGSMLAGMPGYPPTPPNYAITSQGVEGESYYYGFTFGGAFAVNDMFSLSLGGRYIDAYREMKGSFTVADTTGIWPALLPPFAVDYEDTADGWGAIIGLNIAPTEEFNLGIRYETKTSLEFETEQKQDTWDAIGMGFVTDGAKYDRDLPALLGVGASYKITPELKVDANLTYYFNEDADWDGGEDLVDNGYDLGFALEYVFTPQWSASLGYMYTSTGIEPDDMLYEAPELDAHSIAGGVKWSPTDRLDLNFGILKTFYQSETTTPIPGLFPTGVELEKDVINIALGIQYKFW
jgi:long-chain fatty acid transport protein